MINKSQAKIKNSYKIKIAHNSQFQEWKMRYLLIYFMKQKTKKKELAEAIRNLSFKVRN
jgi:hypothetical protein